ncbi:interleukin-6 receptor subunit beta [Oncorhynchus keta]|uniref:interleukin-6 receptor subunit beta n=1 Tax=Oncorhynchus keta TaxID=8018 RepID=UPI0015FB00ED|nr:interleukin-6 receptor subunit beta [Oncorhynchus keta]
MDFLLLYRVNHSWIVTCLLIFSHVMMSCHMEEHSERRQLHELTVKRKDLKRCDNDNRVCVTDDSDCVPRSHVSHERVNISCFFLLTDYALTPYPQCLWSQEYNINAESMHSLIFSQTTPIYSCMGIFSFGGRMNVTLKIKNNMNGMESWSAPYEVAVQEAIKAPCPTITSVNGSDNSLEVTWGISKLHTRCRVRYRMATDKWTEIPAYVLVESAEKAVYTIEGLKPFSSYIIAVSCILSFGHWSDWSMETTRTTLESAPSRPPDICYHLETVNKQGPHHLMLMWKALDVYDAHGHILGYQVSYTQTKHPFLSVTTNTTDLKVVLVVTEDELEVTVMAYNSAGGSPYSHLKIDLSLHQTLPSVRRLWVNSEDDRLVLHWDVGHISLPVSEVANEWATDAAHPTSSHWKRVNGSTRSTVLKDHLQPGTTYRINVYPISNQLCGPPKSIFANLEYGTLLGAVGMHVVDVTKNTVTVQWEWQRKEVHPKVLRYRVILRLGEIQVESIPVWPEVWQHTFFKLRANTGYSVNLLAETSNDNISREMIPIKTHIFEHNEIMFTFCLIVLLTLGLGVFLILSRTVYKTYFFPNIANPGASVVGRWLLESHHEKNRVKNVLKLEEFLITDLSGENGFVELGQERPPVREDGIFNPGSSHSTLNIKHVFIPQNTEYIENTPKSNRENRDSSLMFNNVAHIENGQGTHVENCRGSLLPESTQIQCNFDYIKNKHTLER